MHPQKPLPFSFFIDDRDAFVTLNLCKKPQSEHFKGGDYAPGYSFWPGGTYGEVDLQGQPGWSGLAETIDFECFREPLTRGLGYGDRPQGGRPPFDLVMMFKILILQTR